MLADPGGTPFGVRYQPFNGLYVIVEDIPVDRHGILHAHDELHIKLARNTPVPVHGGRLVNVAQVERLDLRFHMMGAHLAGKPVDQIRRVLIDPGRKLLEPTDSDAMSG